MRGWTGNRTKLAISSLAIWAMASASDSSNRMPMPTDYNNAITTKPERSNLRLRRFDDFEKPIGLHVDQCLNGA